MKKRIVFLCIFFVIITISTNIYAKYVIEYSNTIAYIKIDEKIPKIEMIEVKNSNTMHPQYANFNQTITIKMKVTEENIEKDNFKKENISVEVENLEIIPGIFEIAKKENINGSNIYEIKLKKILSNGVLRLRIKKGTIKDIAGNVNKEEIFNTNIIIDNIAPVVGFQQIEREEGKVLAQIDANERIEQVNAWNLSGNKRSLSKEFLNNVSYPFKITDYAQNIASINVNITKATNVELLYTNLPRFSDWEGGHGNNEILGKKSIQKDPTYKIEMMSLYVGGNIEKDFMEAQTYVHTYWGERYCGLSVYETTYCNGYNPDENKYVGVLNNMNWGNVLGKPSIIFGGDSINRAGQNYLGGTNKPIPADIASKNLFGISALRLRLKNYSYYSIVYQIYVNGYGWQKVCSDDEETTYAHDKPFSAYRVSLIPKTEKQYLVDLWNKDVGTNNMK